jgi:hypothetical protein
MDPSCLTAFWKAKDQGLGLQSREISLPEHRAGQDGGQTEPWLVFFSLSHGWDLQDVFLVSELW